MKLLILTCSTGGGHTSAAKAIAQAAGKAGAECRIEDALQFLPGFDGKVIVRDLWRQKDLGEYTTEFQTKVPYHGVTLVRIIPA